MGPRPTSIGGGFRLDMTGDGHISGLVETLRVDFLQKAQKILQLNLVIKFIKNKEENMKIYRIIYISQLSDSSLCYF